MKSVKSDSASSVGRFPSRADMVRNDAAGGIVLMAAAVLALIVANSPLAPVYFASSRTHVLGLIVVH